MRLGSWFSLGLLRQGRDRVVRVVLDVVDVVLWWVGVVVSRVAKGARNLCERETDGSVFVYSSSLST